MLCGILNRLLGVGSRANGAEDLIFDEEVPLRDDPHFIPHCERRELLFAVHIDVAVHHFVALDVFDAEDGDVDIDVVARRPVVDVFEGKDGALFEAFEIKPSILQ